MPVPQSMLRAGFVESKTLQARRKRVMIGSDGFTDTGKTEFALSAPGPGVMVTLDRGLDPVLDNENPPDTRRDDFAFKIINPPKASDSNDPSFYATYWWDFYNACMDAMKIPECRTLILDGDSDSWELQRLAAFAKTTQVVESRYSDVNAARRAFYSKLHDWGGNVIATNKLKKKYVPILDAYGEFILDEKGKPRQEWKGEYERQGFGDQNYLWHIQLNHLFRQVEKKDKKTGIITLQNQWGIRITKAKVRPEVVGRELWGSMCNVESLLQLVYPNVDPSAWGF